MPNIHYDNVHKDEKTGMPCHIRSKSDRVEVVICAWAEPNNGRMLWQANVWIEGTDWNEKIFSEDWNYLNFNLSNLVLEDPTSHFVYVPVESRAKLVDRPKCNVHTLPYQEVSTLRFLGNSFSQDYLLEVYYDMLVLTSLENYASFLYRQPPDERIVQAYFSEENQIHLTYYPTSDRQSPRTKTIEVADLLPRMNYL